MFVRHSIFALDWRFGDGTAAPPSQSRQRRAVLSAIGAAIGALLLLLAMPATTLGQPFCETAIAAAERSAALPPGLLAAIASRESSRPEPLGGGRTPWPWTINAEGIGRFFASKEDAIRAVHDLSRRGVRSIDVGCLQVNLLHHPHAFASLAEAFDPTANAAYAARYLTALFFETGNWLAAAAAYHSHTPALAAPYRQAVLALWAGGLFPRGVPPPAPRPFAPLPLAGNTGAVVNAQAVARLIAATPHCVGAASHADSWAPPTREANCVGSPFSSVPSLRRVSAGG